MTSDLTLAATQQIERSIHVIRGQNVMLDVDLAALNGVEMRVLLQSVRRHPDRFPDDFAFQLTKEEYDRLRSQIVTSNGRGGRRYRPYAFTEQGVARSTSPPHRLPDWYPPREALIASTAHPATEA